MRFPRTRSAVLLFVALFTLATSAGCLGRGWPAPDAQQYQRAVSLAGQALGRSDAPQSSYVINEKGSLLHRTPRYVAATAGEWVVFRVERLGYLAEALYLKPRLLLEDGTTRDVEPSDRFTFRVGAVVIQARSAAVLQRMGGEVTDAECRLGVHRDLNPRVFDYTLPGGIYPLVRPECIGDAGLVVGLEIESVVMEHPASARLLLAPSFPLAGG